MNKIIPWSRVELLRRMREAGWKRLDGPGSVYEHQETGMKFYPDNYDQKRGTEWRYYANQRRLPMVEAVTI